MTDARIQSDEELVQATLGDKNNYRHIVRRYHDPLLRYVLRLGCKNEEDSEDILQEVFIKTYLNLNDFDPEMKFSSWIYRIAHNETMSHFRKMKIRPQPIEKEEDLLLFELIPDEYDMEKESDKKRITEIIQQALKAIDKKYRDVIVLKYLEERSYEEISDILQKPTGTIATLLNRAKQRLQVEFKKQNIHQIL